MAAIYYAKTIDSKPLVQKSDHISHKLALRLYKRLKLLNGAVSLFGPQAALTVVFHCVSLEH
jgi:hypothetical protein